MMTGKNFKEDKEFTCSREFAEWMIRTAASEGKEKEHWENAVMRYCSPQYPEMIREELKKGNEFCYHIDFDRDAGSVDLRPSYDIVNILLPDRIGNEHFEDGMKYGPCTYSVLTTSGMIPGYAHCRDYYDIDEDVLYSAVNGMTEWVIKESGADTADIQAIRQRKLGDRVFVLRDRYSIGDFYNAVKNDFTDYYPGSGSTHCPDRVISENASFNIVRILLSECISIIEELGIKHDHPLIYAYDLCRTVLYDNVAMPGHSGMPGKSIIEIDDDELEEWNDMEDMEDTHVDTVTEKTEAIKRTQIEVMLEDADGRYADDIKNADKRVGEYDLTLEDLIYAFLRCEIKTEIDESPEPVADYKDRPYIYAERDCMDLKELVFLERIRDYLPDDDGQKEIETPEYLKLLEKLIG